MDDNETTTISVRFSVKRRLQKFGRFEEDWDDLLNRLMDEVERK